jgi:hypothetical protein
MRLARYDRVLASGAETGETVPVIDVDCHFDVGLSPEEHPLRDWADRLPTVEQSIANSLAGDLRRHTPEPSRPAEEALALYLPDSNRSSAEQAAAPGLFEPRFPPATPVERVAWVQPGWYRPCVHEPGRLGLRHRLPR